MKVIVINPPLVQLNSPYPSGAYLSNFFKKYDNDVIWFDLSIELFYSIFSQSGLEKLFELSEKKALKMAAAAEKNDKLETAYNLWRYVSTKKVWIEWIDFITGILRDGEKGISGREKEHQFLFSPFAPRGNRMDTYLELLEKAPTVDDVHFLCSLALADLADYITYVFDEDFSLIRYAEEFVSQKPELNKLEHHLKSPVLENFYKPVLEKMAEQINEKFQISSEEKMLFCISVPFAGTFLPSIYTAQFLKEKYGLSALVSMGGGYVNTELRDFSDCNFSNYVDMLSFDRGYGSYIDLFRVLKDNDFENCNNLYKLRLFRKNHKNKTVAEVTEVCWENKSLFEQEEKLTAEVMPDYSCIDFSKYLRVCDEKNQMHRLWTDGTWLKAYLAHGCYWHKCAFCDTKLDYVCGYKPVNVETLFYSLKHTAEEKGIYGVHFVDEALPTASLRKFALLNARNGNKLYFWGNVRFEKSFTKDLAAFLSYCGFGAVSAGIEVATGEGLKNINKGTDLSSIVSACAAFKEAGILVHAYMIYGFWYDTPQTIIDSMETLRQFFAVGLLDSAFWHKFMLTENSELYEKLKNTFTKKEAQKYEKYGAGLEAAVDSWMHGQKIEMKLQKWFDFPVPAPTIPRDYVEKLIDDYERKNDYKLKLEDIDSVYWLGSEPVVVQSNGESVTLAWIYLQEDYSEKRLSEKWIELLQKLSPKTDENERKKAVEEIKKSPKLQVELQRFHNSGLVIIQHQPF